MQHAAEWFALLSSSEVTHSDRRQWQAWLDSAAEHRAAWRYVEHVSSRFAPLQDSPAREAATQGFRTANTRMARRRQVLRTLAALGGGSGLLGWAAWQYSPLPARVLAGLADYRTDTGEVRQVVLPDGTQVWLSTASAFNREDDTQLRRLRLVAGEVLIQTAADPHRPFVVDTPQGRLRALGTRFTVRLQRDATLAAVFEGAVEIRTAGAGATRVLEAGEQLRFTEDALTPTQPADAARQAWTRGILIADNTPLAEVLRELQRYRGGHLGVSPAAAPLSVAGSYPLTDPDRALAMLEAVLPIRVRHLLPWWVSVEMRHHAAGR